MPTPHYSPQQAHRLLRYSENLARKMRDTIRTNEAWLDSRSNELREREREMRRIQEQIERGRRAARAQGAEAFISNDIQRQRNELQQHYRRVQMIREATPRVREHLEDARRRLEHAMERIEMFKHILRR